MMDNDSNIPEGFKMTEIGVLPEEWDMVTLGDIAQYINGYAFKPADWSQSGRPIIRIQNLNDKSKPYNFHEGQIDGKYFIRDGDLLISWSASLGAFIWRGNDAWLNQHIFKVVVNDQKVSKSDLVGYLPQCRLSLMDLGRHQHIQNFLT